MFFGLGEATGSITATIRWPSGLLQKLENLAPDHRYSVTEGLEVSKREPFLASPITSLENAQPAAESLPNRFGNWLLSPVTAPKAGANLAITPGEAALLVFGGGRARPQDGDGFRIIQVDPGESKNSEICEIYNLLFRHLFDRHVDMPLPSAFLIDETGQIVKVYQGEVELKEAVSDSTGIPRSVADRLTASLPFDFPGQRLDVERNYLSLGSIFFQAGYIAASGEFFRAALQDNRSNAEAFYGLGSVYLRQNDIAQAKDCFEKATALQASYPETQPNAWNNLGLIAIRKNDLASAKSCFQRALKADPGYFTAMVNLGNIYKQEKSWDEAERILTAALAINSTDPEANYSLGMVYAQTGDQSKAFIYLQKALSERPAYPEALNNLGVLYLRTHRPDDAVETFEKCISVAPSFDQSYLNLSRVYAIEGNPDKAKSVLRALLVQHPGHAAAQRALEELH